MEPSNNDNFDQWLDNALSQYGNAEPRAGLEGRVVATLAAKAGRARFSNPSRWALATLSVATLLVFIWLGVGQRGLRGPEKTSRTTFANTDDQRVMKLRPPNALQLPVTRLSRHKRDHALRKVVEVRSHRLEQFPSSRPLSQQELLFARYAERFPQDAMVVAQEQRNFEEETRRAEQNIRNSSPISDEER